VISGSFTASVVTSGIGSRYGSNMMRLNEVTDLQTYERREFIDQLPRDQREWVADNIRYFDFREAEREAHIVKYVDGQIAGIAGVQQNPYNANELWIKFVSVAPEYRQQGIAGELVEGILEYAEQRDYTVKRSSPTEMGAAYLPSVWKRATAKYPNVEVKGSD
jgi:GNAT superfamily N-acetyltransferase